MSRATPAAIIGSGVTRSRIVGPAAAARFDLPASYVLYAGRIDRNKGVDTLFRYYAWLVDEWPDAPLLVLAGHQVLDVPVIRRSGTSATSRDEEKAALLAGAAVVDHAERVESLSILVLEAWALGTPVLVNARCRVLEGQCRRSDGGLYYRDLAEFSAMLKLLMADRRPARRARRKPGAPMSAREYSWAIAADENGGTARRPVASSSPTIVEPAAAL